MPSQRTLDDNEEKRERTRAPAPAIQSVRAGPPTPRQHVAHRASDPATHDVSFNTTAFPPNGGFVEATRPGEVQGAAGSKMDADKISLVEMFFEYFPDATVAVAWVSEYGTRKYTRMGWKTVPHGITRYLDAGLRHTMSELREGPYDIKDSGLAHAAQHAWNALARLQLLIDAGEVEIRRGNELDEKRRPILNTALPRR